ncbi:hypothetical protein CPC08DRAFT_633707 [Agrocybe pediades]|nr:hypothetical protein CPC08DRAFT_633707 [Agrocybe pediades]
MTQRRPLANRHVQGPSNPSPSLGKQSRIVSGSKRAHSSDQPDIPASVSAKRARIPVPDIFSPPPARDTQKERRHAERNQKAVEFKQKYTRAFPSWTFYIDSESMSESMQQSLKARIQQLKGKVEIFFAKEITHVITDAPVNADKDKENMQSNPTTSKLALKSPVKLTNRNGESEMLVQNALRYGMKIWSTAKLESVLSRCMDAPPAKSIQAHRSAAASHLSLSALLQTERLLGSTERDPTQRRHDYRYFSKGSCFVLIEDLSQELATIAAHEYPVFKDKDKQAKKPWPVLHCHPLSRNPFIPFDDREKRRWEKLQQQQAGKAEEESRKKRELETFKRKSSVRKHVQAQGDLRRSVSLNNMHRRLSLPEGNRDKNHYVDLENNDYDDYDSANASGYASGAGAYIAASGNSVGITSTTGTTSTSGQFHRNFQLPNALQERLKNHVVTSLKFTNKERMEHGDGDIEMSGVMGPPAMLPSKHVTLRKSKSTSTLKLPKREETTKPGYCESCRARFDDFAVHMISKKHKKFATNPANFEVLDVVLDRLRRKTRAEAEEQSRLRVLTEFKLSRFHHRGRDTSSAEPFSP